MSLLLQSVSGNQIIQGQRKGLHSEKRGYDFESSKGKEEKEREADGGNSILILGKGIQRSQIMPSHAKSANFLICWLVLRDTGREQTGHCADTFWRAESRPLE